MAKRVGGGIDLTSGLRDQGEQAKRLAMIVAVLGRHGGIPLGTADDIAAGRPAKLPMPSSGAADVSPDGKRMVYSPLWRDFRTWKRYRGGMASEIWFYDLEKKTAERLLIEMRDKLKDWLGSAGAGGQLEGGAVMPPVTNVVSVATTVVAQETNAAVIATNVAVAPAVSTNAPAAASAPPVAAKPPAPSPSSWLFIAP